MTIKTLEYIHELLLDDMRTREGMRKFSSEQASKAEEDYEDKKITKAKLDKAKEEKEKYWQLYIKAKNALDDFEAQDF